MKLLNLTVPPRTEFDNKINEILNRAEYRHLKNGIRDLIQSLQEKLSQWFQNAFDKIEFKTGPGISDKLATAFIILGIIVILALIIMIAVKISRVFEKKSRIKMILGERIGARTTPDSLREKASASLAQGDLRQAVRYDFIALLLLMHEKRLIYIDETKTNQEIYDYLKQNGFKQLQVFQGMIDTFNYLWYGHKSVEGIKYEAWSSKLNLLWNEVMNCEVKGK